MDALAIILREEPPDPAAPEPPPLVARAVGEPRGRLVADWRARCKGGVETSYGFVPYQFSLSSPVPIDSGMIPKMDVSVPDAMAVFARRGYRVLIFEDDA